jgi:hypothetical protein
VRGSGPIARAQELCDAGRSLDAIRVLTDANRAAHDDDVERALVDLRHDAFASLDFSGPPQPPAPVTASTASPGPLVEVTPEQLTLETLRTSIARHGCVLVRGLVPRPRADQLAEGIDRVLAGFDAANDGAPIERTMPWYAPFEPRAGNYRVGGRRNWVRAGGAVWTADSPRMLFELCELIDDVGVGSLVTAYLGERPALSANKCTLRRVPVTTNGDWHQDGAFLGERVRTLNFWLSLSHCGTEAPGMDILPRRLDRVVETGTDGAIFDWAVSPAVVAQLAETAPVTRPEFAPGDALLFDHLFLHRTAADPGMQQERHAMETWFFAPSTYPDGQIGLVY